MNNRIIVITSLIVVAIFSRLIPHYPNFTAVGAAALLGGALYKRGYLAFLVPFVALFLSDLVLNNVIYARYYDGFQFMRSSFWVTLLGFGVAVVLGRYAIKSFKVLPIASSAVVAAIAFFLISNFAVWVGSTTYTKDITGLIACYTAGLPFLLNGIIGNLLFCGVLFSAAFYLLGEHKLKPVNA